LGFQGLNDDDDTKMMIEREIVKMSIRVDSERCVHFHELLYRVMRRLYGSHDLLNSAFDMQLYEMVTQKKVARLTTDHGLKHLSYSGIANPLMSLF
jgi:hypothetical protein